MSISRRLRRAAMQGKRPEDITVKVGGRGSAPITARRDNTVMPPLINKVYGHGEQRKG